MGYFTKKYDVQLGDISSNTLGLNVNGKGIRAGLNLNDQNKVGTFFINGNTFQEFQEKTAIGAFHYYKGNKASNKLTYTYFRNKDMEC